jgi:hypothetical protein
MNRPGVSDYRGTQGNSLGGSQGNDPQRHSEGILARAIEEQTAKLPSDIFLWAAGTSIISSLALKLMGRDSQAHFIGQWVPTLLILGLYNKVVKVAGSDRASSQQSGV